MEIDQILTVISTVGFPIACCLILFWFMYKNDNSHKEEVNKLTEAIQNNTIVMQKLVDRIEAKN